MDSDWKFFVFVIGIATVVLGATIMRHREALIEQQRQIDQLYVVTSSLIQRATPAEQWKFYDYEKLPDGKYKMYFPNYRTNSAVLIYLDPNSPKRREEELIHINTTRIPPNILENWPIGEVHDLPQEE